MSGHRPASLVVGTAGHIDHGKTSLVRALTGVDLDTLPEEKERGITIALGFVPLDLPDGRRVAIVDVPGHERLVRTMVAGATGVDAVLLCVSAVDGVMPQTVEHLTVLRVLDVRQAVVVVTFADAVEPDWLELVVDDVRAALRGGPLADAPVVPFSAVTGHGRADVLAAIAAFTPRQRRRNGPFRLPVDRAFVRPGFGTVATGTVWSGAVPDGAQVTLAPTTLQARIRGIHVHGEPAPEAIAGWRAAVNLAGIDVEQVPRGTVLVRGDVAVSHVIDVAYTQLADEPLPDGDPVRVLHGTSEAVGRLYLAEDREAAPPRIQVYAQLRLDTPLVALPGDRFVVRRPSPQATLGGGEIVDPWAPRMRQRDRVAAGAQLRRLHRGEVTVWLDRAGEEGLPAAAWAQRGTGGVALADRVLAARVVARLTGALLAALERYHREQPLALGANRRELRRDRLGHLDVGVFDALVEHVAATGSVVVQGPLVHLAGFTVALGPDQVALRDRVLATVVAAGLGGVTPEALAAASPDPQTTALAWLLEKAGKVVVVPGVGFVARSAVDGLVGALRTWFSTHDRLGAPEFKELSSQSRKTAIPWLEWLDRGGYTRRSGDVRLAGPTLGR